MCNFAETCLTVAGLEFSGITLIVIGITLIGLMVALMSLYLAMRPQTLRSTRIIFGAWTVLCGAPSGLLAYALARDIAGAILA